MQVVRQQERPKGPSFNWSLLVGFDIFISYRHGLASPYAESLRNSLTTAGFKCFLDEHEPDDTVVLAEAIRKALRKSAMMVVIAEEAILPSKWIPQEVAIARESRKISIVPISIGGWLTGARIDEKELAYLQTLAWVDETQGAFVRGLPSPAVVDHIARRFTRVRVNTRTRGITAGAMAILAASTAVAVYQRNSAVHSEKQTKRSLVRLAVASGIENINSGYLWSAWMWFAEALRIGEEAKFDPDPHRVRLSQVRKRLPELLGVWFHDERSDHIAFLAAGNRFLTVDEKGAIRVWRLDQRGAPELEISDANATSIALDSGGERILALSESRGISCWNVRDGSPCVIDQISRTARQGKLFAGEMFAAISGRQLVIRDLRSGSAWQIDHAANVTRFVVSPSGRIAATVSGGQCFLWDFRERTQQPATIAEAREIAGLAISPDDSYVAITTKSERDDLETSVWSIQGGSKPLAVIQHEAPAERWEFDPRTGGAAAATFVGAVRTNPFEKLVDFSPDGQHLYAISRRLDFVRVWDWQSVNAVTPPLTHFGDSVRAAAFSPDAGMLATTGADGSTRIWSLTTLMGDFVPQRQRYRADDVQFSPDGDRIAFVTWGAQASVRDLASDRELVALRGHSSGISFLDYSRDGRYLLTGGLDKQARVWDAATGQPVTPFLPHAGKVEHGFFSLDGRLVVTVTDGHREPCSLRVWNAATGAPVTGPLVHKSTVRHAEISQDGRFLLAVVGKSYDSDTEAVVWSVSSGRTLFTFRHSGDRIDHALFESTGRSVLTFSGRSFCTWNLSDGSQRGRVVNQSSLNHFVSATPAGDRVLVAGSDGDVAQIVDTRSGLPLTPAMEHLERIESAEFGRDGRRLLTITSKEARVWDPNDATLLAPPFRYLVRAGMGRFSPDGRRLAVVFWRAQNGDASAGSMLLVFKLDPATESTDGLTLEGSVSSVHRIDGAGGFVPIPRNVFQDFASRYKAGPSRYEDRAVLWHKQQAVLTEQNFGVLFHLDQLVRKVPDDPWAYSHRAALRTSADDVEGAIQDYSHLIRLGESGAATHRVRAQLYAAEASWTEAALDFAQILPAANSEDWYKYGVASALAGDHEAASQVCREMIGRFLPGGATGDSDEVWNDIFRTTLLCVLEPRAVADWQQLAGNIQPWTTNDSGQISRSALLLQGAIAYRTGDYATAIESLERSNSSPASTFLLSGTQRALGNRSESERLYAEAVAVVERKEKVTRRYVGWYGELVWQLLARETKQAAAAR